MNRKIFLSAALSALYFSGFCSDPMFKTIKEATDIKLKYDSLIAKGGTASCTNAAAEAKKIQRKNLVYPVLYVPGKQFNGNMADWDKIPYIALMDLQSDTNGFKLPKGLKADFKACITDTHLYLLLNTNDPVRIFRNVTSHYYNHDCFELYLDPLMKRMAAMDDTTSQTFVTCLNDNGKIICSGKLTMEAKYIRKQTGWAAEVRIPLNNNTFKVKPFNGLTIGCNITYCNNDRKKGGCQHKLCWSVLDSLDCSWQTPGVYGYLQVVMPKPAAIKAAELGPEPARRKAIRMSGPACTDLKVLAKSRPNPAMGRGFNGGVTTAAECGTWGANIARFDVIHYGLRNMEYQQALKKGLDIFEKELIKCRKAGVKVIPLLGPRKGYGAPWSDPKSKKAFIEGWKAIVKRAQPYKDVVWAYDLYNEPLDLKQLPYTPVEYRQCMIDTINELRKIDKDCWFVYEVGPGGGWTGFEDLRPLPDTKIAYGLHFYQPGAFTHQGVNFALLQDLSLINKEQKGNILKYPGVYYGTWFDRSEMVRQLKVVIDFQKKYQVPIYVGEFSVVAWAKPEYSVQWLKDVISIFEEYQWSWCYHDFRGWPGWSLWLEDGVFPNPKPSPNSKRAAVIRKALEKNRK